MVESIPQVSILLKSSFLKLILALNNTRTLFFGITFGLFHKVKLTDTNANNK